MTARIDLLGYAWGNKIMCLVWQITMDQSPLGAMAPADAYILGVAVRMVIGLAPRRLLQESCANCTLLPCSLLYPIPSRIISQGATGEIAVGCSTLD